MSAKITVIVYILICFEVGILLIILPWYPTYWEDNLFLYFLTTKLHSQWVPAILTSPYVKGGVTGLGILNLIAGFADIIKFRESVEALSSLGSKGKKSENEKIADKGETSSSTIQSVSVHDNESSGVPPHK